MATYCDIKLNNAQAAIDWYDNVIDTTTSEADSTFAAIDMGDAFIAMGSQKGSVSCKNSQFIFTSQKTFMTNRQYLIDELLKSKSVESIRYNHWSSNQNSYAKLFQNIPNPFSKICKIKMELYVDCQINLDVFDSYGRNILTLAEGNYNKGDYEFTIDGSKLNVGIYWYSLKVNGTYVDSKKMIIFK